MGDVKHSEAFCNVCIGPLAMMVTQLCLIISLAILNMLYLQCDMFFGSLQAGVHNSFTLITTFLPMRDRRPTIALSTVHSSRKAP